MRTRLPMVLPVRQQLLDGGWCTGLGCFLCGLSVLIENKRRRREMALYCAPRALYATMEEIVPSFLSRGKAGKVLSKYLERLVFAASTGTGKLAAGGGVCLVSSSDADMMTPSRSHQCDRAPT